MAKKIIKQLIQRFIPNIQDLKKDKNLKVFGNLLNSTNLWHLNRYSVATAFSTGLFSALIPVPFQMLLAAGLAIIVRANIPISVLLTWVSNPITTPPLLYLEYRIGTFILDMHPQQIAFVPTYEWLMQQFHLIGAPLLLGCFIAAILFAILGNLIVRLFWRISVMSAWKKRLHRLQAMKRRLKRKKRTTDGKKDF